MHNFHIFYIRLKVQNAWKDFVLRDISTVASGLFLDFSICFVSFSNRFLSFTVFHLIPVFYFSSCNTFFIYFFYFLLFLLIFICPWHYSRFDFLLYFFLFIPLLTLSSFPSTQFSPFCVISSRSLNILFKFSFFFSSLLNSVSYSLFFLILSLFLSFRYFSVFLFLHSFAIFISHVPYNSAVDKKYFRGRNNFSSTRVDKKKINK